MLVGGPAIQSSALQEPLGIRNCANGGGWVYNRLQSMLARIAKRKFLLKRKPRELRPGLLEGATTAILRALSFDPQQRFESARDFSELLTGSLQADVLEQPRGPS